ncbi:MAG: hypothetical protein ACR2RE_07400, partial [Geminicoccaceae bacterium]
MNTPIDEPISGWNFLNFVKFGTVAVIGASAFATGWVSLDLPVPASMSDVGAKFSEASNRITKIEEYARTTRLMTLDLKT